MERFELVYEAGLRRFVARVGVGVATADEPIGASATEAVSENMVVDTGSNITILSGDLARRLGIVIGRQETRNVRGITGLARRPVVRDIEVFVGEDAGRVVRLPIVAIAAADVLRGEGRLSPASWKGALLGGPVSVLGMDVARALRARLTLDFKDLKGTLEW